MQPESPSKMPVEAGTKKDEKISDQRSGWDRRMSTRSILRRPFPLVWGLLSFVLLVAFAVITQVQFNSANAEDIYQSNLRTYEAELKVYENAVRENRDCKNAVATRDTYRRIFDGIGDLFQIQANLPVSLFPESIAALEYQQTITQGIIDLIEDPVEAGLPPRDVADCPKVPTSEPVRPER